MTSPARVEAKGGGYDPVRTRKRIIDAALVLFERQGYNGTSVQEIAALAELTKGAFYHHFATKLDLLLTIQEEYLDHQLEILERVALEEEDPLKRIERIIAVGLEMIATHHSHVAIFFQERRFFSEPSFEIVRKKRLIVENMILTAIDDCITRGLIRSDLRPHLVAFSLLGMTAYAFQWYDPSGALSPLEIAHVFCSIAFDGLLPRP